MSTYKVKMQSPELFFPDSTVIKLLKYDIKDSIIECFCFFYCQFRKIIF